MLDIARHPSASASVHTLTGSSRPGAVPPLMSLDAPRPFHPSGQADATAGGRAGPNPALLALVEEFEAKHEEAKALANAAKGVDHDEVPGWTTLEARLNEIAAAMYEIRAGSTTDVLLVCRFLQIPWVQADRETAADLSHNLAEDLLRFFGYAASPAPATPRDLIVDLRHQADAFRAAADAAEDQAAADRAVEQVTAAQDRAIACPPRTFAGAFAALEWARADVLDYEDQVRDEGDRFRIAMLDGALGVLRGIAAPPSTGALPDADLLALAPAWLASAARFAETEEAAKAAEERWQAGGQDKADIAAALAAEADAVS